MYAVSCCASLVGPGGPRRSAERAFSVPFSRARHGVTCKCKCEHLNEATRQERPAKTEPCLRREGRRDKRRGQNKNNIEKAKALKEIEIPVNKVVALYSVPIFQYRRVRYTVRCDGVALRGCKT